MLARVFLSWVLEKKSPDPLNLVLTLQCWERCMARFCETQSRRSGKTNRVRKAESLPGVLGVVTHEDAPDLNWMGVWDNYRGKVLDGIARFVGDEIAAVAATTVEIAEQALELIEVEYEPLPAVLDVKKGIAR
ncbi:MAG: hypothetical protein CM1200mP18_09140 [Gammaproteobacteria bacterium]|nr:MAG: hypothetical protein CM1200mP18_09140 [Gammaproteobacteria bacterium]